MELKNLDAHNKTPWVYGLYINIDCNSEKVIRSMRKIDGDHHADVIIIYRGRPKMYSLGEFLERLGFYDGETS